MIKNNGGITGFLQKNFYYGDDRLEDGTVHEFLDYINSTLDPATGKLFDVSGRTVYDWIQGRQHVPADLLPWLCNFFGDPAMFMHYGVKPHPEAREKIRRKVEARKVQLADMDKELDKIRKDRQRLLAEIDGAAQLDLPEEEG